MANLNIAVVLSGVDQGAGSMVASVTQGLGGLADIATGAVSYALGGVLKDALDAATGAMGDFFGEALAAEQQQAGLAALIKSVNSEAIDQAAQLAAAQTVTTTTTVLSGDKLEKLQDQIAHATAKLDDMRAAYPKLKHPTEVQTLALQEQQEKLDELTAAYNAGSQVITSTSSALTAMSGAGSFSIDVVNKLATQFRDLVGGSDEAVLSIEEIAIRSGAVSQEQLPAFIKTVADLGVVMGDTSTAATILARAQEDPVAAMGRLQRAGIIFSDALKDQIKNLAKHNDLAGATALIMDRVAVATGGAAAANANTLAGRWSILTEHLADAGKEIALRVLPGVEKLFDQYIAPNIPVVENLASAVGDQLGRAIDYVSSSFSAFPGDVVGAIADLLYKLAYDTGIPGLADLGDVVAGLPADFAALRSAIQPVIDTVVANLPTLQQMIRDAFGWFSAHQEEVKGALIGIGAAIAGAGIVSAVLGIGAVIAGLVSPIGLVIAAAAVLGAAWAGNWGDIQGKTAAAWAALQPVLAQLWQWLQVNLPVALAWLSNVWQTVHLTAIQNVWTWMQTVLFPLLADLWQWLQVNGPIALQTLATFWQTILLPAIRAVWTFLTTIWWPMMLNLWTWLSTTLTAALQTLSNFWTTVLLPAIKSVWSWMTTVLFPFLTALTNFIEAVFEYDLKALSAIWSGTLLSAITDVWKYLNENVLPIFKTVSEYLSKTFGPAITTFGGIVQGLVDGALTNLKKIWDAINTAIQTVISALNNLADIIRHLPPPPPWWKPGSPTPFELGLRGIGAAALELAQTQLPALTGQVNLLPAPALAGSGAVGGGQALIINVDARGSTLTEQQIQDAVTRGLVQAGYTADGRLRLGVT